MEYNYGKSAKSLGIVDADADTYIEVATRRFSS